MTRYRKRRSDSASDAPCYSNESAESANDSLSDFSELRTKEVEQLLAVLASIDNSEEIFRLLVDLFTVREIRDVSQRLRVARMLSEGRSYCEIEEDTGASATTIARVSKCLALGPGGYATALDALKKAET